MADFNESIGRGRRLQFAVQHIKNSEINNLQDQLHMAGSYQYTNESIENFYHNMADRYYNDCPGYSSNHQMQKEINPPCQPLTSSQFSDDDLDIQEIGSETSSLDLYSLRSSPIGLNEVKRNDSPFEPQLDAEDDVIAPNIPYNPTHVYFEETTHFQNSQFKIPPPKVMGRGQILRKITAKISKPGRTLENEIVSTFGTEYTNQSIEKFVERLTREKDDKN